MKGGFEMEPIYIINKYFSVIKIQQDIDYYSVLVDSYYAHYDVLKELSCCLPFKGIRSCSSLEHHGKLMFQFLR